MKWIGAVAAVLYVGTVWAANYAVQHLGTDVTPAGVHTIPVWPGLVAPSGVLFVGLAFSLRDITQRLMGRGVVVVCILLGAALAYWLSNTTTVPGGQVNLALASALAFLLSETADFSIYTPLRERGWLPAVAASNGVGLLVDSALFLWLAFGSLAFFWGQAVGKAWMTVLAIVVVVALRRSMLDRREAEALV